MGGSPHVERRGTLRRMDLRAIAQPRRADDDEGGHGAPPLYVLAWATLALSIAVGVAMVTSAACGGNGKSSPPAASGHIGTVTNTATAPPATQVTQSPTQSAATVAASPSSAPPTIALTTATASTAPPTSTNGGGAPQDASPVVACALLAPVDQNHRVDRGCVLGPLVDAGGGNLLQADAVAAFKKMAADASAAGLTIFAVSGYRGYDLQQTLYDHEVRNFGPNQKTVALPGHSEHQLGTTVDVNDVSEGFGTTAEGKWLQQNSTKYGFVISYPAGREGLTGYAYEPWHIRFVGVGTAQAQAASGTTLNRFLGGG